MANEFIELNVIPNGEKPVFHAAQYDVGRPIIIKLKKGEDDFTPTGLTLELQVRKVDNNIVTAASSSVDGNIVTFLTTEQMTACSGTNLCEVQLSDESTTIATLHFFLVVQRDVLNGGLSSASEIHDLEEQIAEIVPEVIGDDYYDKTEVDALIAEHTFDPTNYYDKQETDQAIQDAISEVPIFDPTNYYDKAATNALLADKANTSDLATVATSGDYDDLLNKPTLPDMSNYYTKSETYNKTEVDNALATKQDKIETKTASGDLITISDGGDNIPLKSCEIEIEPDLNGHTESNLVVCGKNLFNKATIVSNKWFSDNGSEIAISGRFYSALIPVLPNTDYYLTNVVGAGSFISTVHFASDLTIVGAKNITGSNTQSGYITTFSNSAYMIINGFLSDIDTVQVVKGDTATTYEAYNGTTYTTTFGQTVYGGEGNALTGEFVSEWGKYTITNDTILNTYNTSEYGSWARVSQIGVQKIDNTNIMVFCDMATGIPFNQRTAAPNQRRVYTDETGQVVIRAAATDNITSLGDLKNLFMGANICYALATPTSLSLTGVNPKTISGINNIYNDCGSTEIEYFTESADNIAALIRVMTGG